VLWASSGRSSDTAARAEATGLTDVGDIGEVLSRSEVVFSICPPHAALDLARAVAGFTGVFVDANAISPSHSDEVRSIIEAGGASYVDGGIIGAPPPSDTTRLYLSGDRATEIAALFSTDEVATKVLDGAGSAASAMKMAYGAWTKGTAAMMLDIRALARANGVEDALVAEWTTTSPELIGTARRAARQAQDRGWRWIGEMAEIAHTFSEAGLPAGFHEASGEIYSKVPRKMNATVDDETLAEVIDLLLQKDQNA
jgi:3-hydroxyisobutyrate dehydrogenase-like beta-hydroxyacid dehydrogenase